MSKIVNISEAASIAIHSMVLIANSERLLNASDLSIQMKFSKNHLSKVLQSLTKNQYLESVRGPKGGFLLGKKPEQINLLELFELVDGRFELEECHGNCTSCMFRYCIFGGLTSKFAVEFHQYLEQTTLKDLIKIKSV